MEKTEMEVFQSLEEGFSTDLKYMKLKKADLKSTRASVNILVRHNCLKIPI